MTWTSDPCEDCEENPTHEVRPPNPDRDDWVEVCEFHARELRPISAEVRPIDESRRLDVGDPVAVKTLEPGEAPEGTRGFMP